MANTVEVDTGRIHSVDGSLKITMNNVAGAVVDDNMYLTLTNESGEVLAGFRDWVYFRRTQE
jgi:hypothetical protein